MQFHGLPGVNKKIKLSLSMPWRQVRGVEVELHSFLTLALDGGGVSVKLQAPAALPPGKNSGTH
jgi:hypothetical protein